MGVQKRKDRSAKISTVVVLVFLEPVVLRNETLVFLRANGVIHTWCGNTDLTESHPVMYVSLQDFHQWPSGPDIRGVQGPSNGPLKLKKATRGDL